MVRSSQTAAGALHGFLRHPSGTRGHNARHHEEATTQHTSVRRSRSRRTGGTSTTTRGRTARSASLRGRSTRRGSPPLRSGLRPLAQWRQARSLCFRWNQPDSHSAGPEIGGQVTTDSWHSSREDPDSQQTGSKSSPRSPTWARHSPVTVEASPSIAVYLGSASEAIRSMVQRSIANQPAHFLPMDVRADMGS